MRRSLQEQITQIIDEGKGHSRSIIVQMETGEKEADELLVAASQAAKRRGMLLMARGALPPPRSELKKIGIEARKRKSKARRTTSAGLLSMASAAAEIGFGAGLPGIQKNAATHIAHLLASTFVRQAMASDAERRKKAIPKHSDITKLWSSASVVMNVSKDDLANLPKQVSGIRGIFPNRSVSIPPIMEISPQQLPESVKDNKTSTWGLEAIGALAVWGAYGAEGQGVKVAVLDTGMDPNHPDLAGRMATADWAEFGPGGNRIPNSTPRDSAKHGTHCCGIVAGGGNSGRWIGVAPAAALAAGMVLPGGGGTDAQILAGLEWAIGRGVDVISMSLGGLQLGPEVLDIYTRTMIRANQAGIPVVVAIGNEGSQTSGSPGNDYFALTIGATDSEDRAAGFSGGRTQVVMESDFVADKYLPFVYSKPDLAAPGVAVKSCVPGNEYAVWNGTSMAAPHVAGALALLLSATNIKQDVPANERAYVLQDLLLGSVEELGEAGQDHRFGLGRMNILRTIGNAIELGY